MPEEEMFVREIDGVDVPLNAQDLAEFEADPEGFTAQVIKDREIMSLSGPDTTEEARKLVEEREIPDDDDYDPTDFGDELITSPPKAGDK